MDVCQVTLATLTDESIVTDCGFVVPACDGNADVVSDDRFAHKMGTLCLELVGRRIMRILNVLRGLPQHLLVMLVNGELGRKAMQLFRRDLVTYEDASRDFANVPSVHAILRFSPFKTNLLPTMGARILSVALANHSPHSGFSRKTNIDHSQLIALRRDVQFPEEQWRYQGHSETTRTRQICCSGACEKGGREEVQV